MKKFSSFIFYTQPIVDIPTLSTWIRSQKPMYTFLGDVYNQEQFNKCDFKSHKNWWINVDIGSEITPHSLVFKTYPLDCKLFVVLSDSFFDNCLVDVIRDLNKKDAVLIPRRNIKSPYMYLLYEQLFYKNYKPKFIEKIQKVIELYKEKPVELYFNPVDPNLSFTDSELWTDDPIFQEFKNKYEKEFYNTQTHLVKEWNNFCGNIRSITEADFKDVEIIRPNA